MAPRIKWSGPKKALMLKQEPGAKDDLKNDPTYNPKAFRLSRVKDSKSRITKRSQSAQTPHIKREPRSVTPSAINKPNANVSHRRRMKDVDDLEIRMKDNNIHYEIRMFAKPTDRVGALINVWKERRRGLSDPRFLLNDERILNEDSTLQNLGVEDGDTIDVFYEVTGGSCIQWLGGRERSAWTTLEMDERPQSIPLAYITSF